MSFTDDVRFVSYRHLHHAAHSGYERLTRYCGKSLSAEPLPKSWIPNRLMQRIANGVDRYNRESLATELSTAAELLLTRKTFFHVLYAERSYRYLGWLNGFRGNRVVASFHHPTWKIHGIIHTESHMKQLSAAICLGSSQMEDLERILGRDRVFLVPHGVDTVHYSPAPVSQPRSSNLFLCVGNHLRDFTTLREAAHLLALENPAIEIVVVTKPKNFSNLMDLPNVTLRSGLPERELIQLYREAALLMMPLHDTVSNNALLEAMACGLPVVTTDIGSVRDYTTRECARLTRPDDAKSMVEAALDLAANTGERARMGEAGRKRALEFAWPEIVRRLNEVYGEIA